MKGKNVRKDIVRDLLDKNFQEFTMQAASGVYPTLLIRESGTIARLLHFEMFVTQAEKLLQSSPTEAFYKGMITNIPRPDEAPQRLRIIPELSQIEQQYPLYDHQRIIDFIKKLSLSEEHLALCLQGSIDEAFKRFGEGLKAEEIASTLAMLGEFEKAKWAVANVINEPSRQFGVRLVMCFELFFSERRDEAFEIFEAFPSQEMDGWTRLHFVLGFSGRVPWGGYPYPDY